MYALICMRCKLYHDRIFKFFNSDTTDDITQEEWLTGFSVFLKGLDFCHHHHCNTYQDNCKIGSEHMCIIYVDAIFKVDLSGDLSEQTRYCFDIYDLNSDGYISRFPNSYQYFSEIPF